LAPIELEDRAVDAIYLGIVVVFFALCVGMVRLFEKLKT
jgi:hypothetical protein